MAMVAAENLDLLRQEFRARLFNEWGVTVLDDSLLDKTVVSTVERRNSNVTRRLTVPGQVNVVSFFSAEGKLINVQSFAI